MCVEHQGADSTSEWAHKQGRTGNLVSQERSWLAAALLRQSDSFVHIGLAVLFTGLPSCQLYVYNQSTGWKVPNVSTFTGIQLVLSYKLFSIHLYLALSYGNVQNGSFTNKKTISRLRLSTFFFFYFSWFLHRSYKGRHAGKSSWPVALLAPFCVKNLETCINNGKIRWKCQKVKEELKSLEGKESGH